MSDINTTKKFAEKYADCLMRLTENYKYILINTILGNCIGYTKERIVIALIHNKCGFCGKNKCIKHIQPHSKYGKSYFITSKYIVEPSQNTGLFLIKELESYTYQLKTKLCKCGGQKVKYGTIFVCQSRCKN